MLYIVYPGCFSPSVTASYDGKAQERRNIWAAKNIRVIRINTARTADTPPFVTKGIQIIFMTDTFIPSTATTTTSISSRSAARILQNARIVLAPGITNRTAMRLSRTVTTATSYMEDCYITRTAITATSTGG